MPADNNFMLGKCPVSPKEADPIVKNKVNAETNRLYFDRGRQYCSRESKNTW